MAVDLFAFARCYRGRHRPEDALFWLHHSSETGPSGAEPAQRMFIRLADHYAGCDDKTTAGAILEVLADLLAHDRRMTLDAMTRSTVS